MTPEEVQAIASKWLKTCGSCDAGQPTECVCADGDPRAPIHELVAEVNSLHAAIDAWRATVNNLRASLYAMRATAQDWQSIANQQGHKLQAAERNANAKQNRIEQLEGLEDKLQAAERNANAKRSQVGRLEEALAVAADELLAYKDYYGTSPAQVRHLQLCGLCTANGCQCYPTERCPDYPSE